MVLLPLIAVILGTTDAALRSVVVFIVEAFAVWTFGVYWLVKSAELKATDAQRLVLEGKLQAVEQTGVRVTAPGRLVQVEP